MRYECILKTSFVSVQIHQHWTTDTIIAGMKDLPYSNNNQGKEMKSVRSNQIVETINFKYLPFSHFSCGVNKNV